MSVSETVLSKRKKRLLKIIVPLLLVLLICTFLSRTIAGMFIPTVTVAAIETGSLSSKADFKGIVDYEDVQQLTAQTDWTITNLYVHENQTVKKGDLLFEIDMDQANILILQQRAAVKQMQATKKEAKTAQEAEIIQLQLEAQTQKLALLEKQYPEDGKIYAEQNGTITGIAIENYSMVNQGELLMRLIPDTAQPVVSWEMDLDTGEIFKENDKVTIKYISYNYTENQVVEQEFDSVLSKKNFQPSTNRYSCSAPFSYTGALAEGKPVEVSLTKESSQYDLVVPTSCLLAHETNRNDMGNIYVLETRESLFGTEYVTKKVEVSILDRNNLRAAISGKVLSPGMKVIANVSGLPVQDQSVVKVDQA